MAYRRPAIERIVLVGSMYDAISCPPGSIQVKDQCVFQGAP